MKNLLFWLYAVIAIVLIALGYTYWESKVTDSAAQDNAITQSVDEDSSSSSNTKKEKKEDSSAKPNKNLFKNKELQGIYDDKTKDGKKMNITLVSTPYQTSEENTNVKDELNYVSDAYIKVTDVEVPGVSTSFDTENIYKTNPDIILMDALTLNDFYEEIPINDHINTLESIYNNAENQNNIPVVIIGTRPEYNDSDFNEYQRAEEEYFSNKDNNFKYINQSSKWPNNKAIADYYNVDDGLLTDRGVNRWVTSITDYLFNEE
ncbi:hypothetical protein [Macrococcus lamae]|uniref:SGNH/GDSL hydrolase family protein n=1 Tax=Macrococcus lamae TaxID=198484 RepID=A0A4R6BVN1_9STAP|nr:hypothetical protein [Macrococcus lamae]TDM12067.1 hypothetical protein ERX29_04415 [Macrococcus lamae]